MKWEGRWWGIRIIAENDDDSALLWRLVERLPSKASSSYEDGEFRHEPNDTNIYIKLIFER